MDASLATALGAGFLIGVRHAVDADHVAAVSTLVSRERSPARSCLLGAFWGFGHSVSLLLVGGAMISLRVTVPPDAERAVELLAAGVLALLGGQAMLRSLRGFRLHGHQHVHGDHAHHHVHLHVGPADDHAHSHLARLAGRPFLVGALHGLAGSGTLMLLVLAMIPSPVVALGYLLVFGFGSTVAMLVLSGLIGIPFAFATRRSEAVTLGMQALTGAASLMLGVVFAWSAIAG